MGNAGSASYPDNHTYLGQPNSKEQSKTYKRLLKDIKKLRIRDQTNQYNPHRRDVSILNCLPTNLKQFSKTIHAVNEFWLTNIKCLHPNSLHEMAMLSYCHLYCQVTPKARQLLLKAHKGSVPSHTLAIFTIFEYVIRIMSDSNPMSHTKLFKQLKAIAALHKPFNSILGAFDVYELMLDSFHYAMDQTFHQKYTIRVRFCFAQLYRVVVNIMNNNDLRTLVLSDHRSRNNAITSPTSASNTPNDHDINIDPRYILKDVDKFLISFEDCLSDDVGSLYFKMYLEERFCVENYLFHEAVLKYKSMKKNQRIKVGTGIIHTFIHDNAEKQVNVSYATKNKILSIIHLTQRMNANKEKYQNIMTLTQLTETKSQTTHQMVELCHDKKTAKYDVNLEDIVYSAGFTDHLFDAAYDEIFYLMKSGMWMSFRNTILEWCNNDHFSKQQKVKYRAQKNEENTRRNIVKNVHDLAKLKTRNQQAMTPVLGAQKSIILIARPSKTRAKTRSKTHGHDVHRNNLDYDGDSEGSNHGDAKKTESPNHPIETIIKTIAESHSASDAMSMASVSSSSEDEEENKENHRNDSPVRRAMNQLKHRQEHPLGVSVCLDNPLANPLALPYSSTSLKLLNLNDNKDGGYICQISQKHLPQVEESSLGNKDKTI